MRAVMTKGSTRLAEDWDTPDLSPISLWKVPMAKNPRTWTCGGIGFDRRVSLWSCGSNKLHICSSIVFGNLNRDVSHSSVSARISTRSLNTRSLRRAWRAKASKSSKSVAGYTSHWPCYIQSQINLQLVHNSSQTESCQHNCGVYFLYLFMIASK